MERDIIQKLGLFKIRIFFNKVSIKVSKGASNQLKKNLYSMQCTSIKFKTTFQI